MNNSLVERHHRPKNPQVAMKTILAFALCLVLVNADSVRLIQLQSPTKGALTPLEDQLLWLRSSYDPYINPGIFCK